MQLIGVHAGLQAAYHCLRDQPFHGAAQLKDILDEPRADVRILLIGHQKHCLYLRSQAPVHQSHLQLVLVVADGANPAQNGLSMLFENKLHQQPIEGRDRNVIEALNCFGKHLDPLRNRKERRLLRVVQDRDHQVIKDLCPTRNQIQMTVGQRIEAAGVNGFDGIQESLLSKTHRRLHRFRSLSRSVHRNCRNLRRLHPGETQLLP